MIVYWASKLFKIILINPKSNKDINNYFAIINFYENDCFPISNLFARGNIMILLRRWREFIDIIYYFYVIKIKKKLIYTTFHDEQVFLVEK